MDWLRLWHDLPTDPKFRSIAKLSNQHLTAVLALYQFLLVDASKNTMSRGVTLCHNDDIASALDLEIEQVEAIKKAMQNKVLDGNKLTGWEKRQPKKEDEKASERKRRQREREKENECHAMSHDVTTDTDTDTEKIRKDIEQNTSVELEVSSSPLVEVIDDPVFILIPLVKGGEQYAVTENVVREFEANYPAVDVRQQLRSFRAWSLSNPKKRKTKRGILASINSWLSRHQDRPTQKQTHAIPYKLSSVEHNQLVLEQIRAEEREKREKEPRLLEDDHAVH